jgi:hypothetical protein
MKRYVVEIDLYVYADNDEDAKAQAQEIADNLDLDSDNKADVKEISELSWGSMRPRKVELK